MFEHSDKYYDILYEFKNYKEESKRIKEIIKEFNPSCQNILDVACGTGEHARYLQDDFHVDGLDINKNFLKIAKKKKLNGNFYHGDMTNFTLDKKYDVILCLFSSIGYVLNERNLKNTMRCFQKHLNENGVVILEPWFTLEQWNPENPKLLISQKNNIKICRIDIGKVKGTVSELKFHYMIGHDSEVNYFVEEHKMALFSENQMKQSFENSRFSVLMRHEKYFRSKLYIAKKS